MLGNNKMMVRYDKGWWKVMKDNEEHGGMVKDN